MGIHLKGNKERTDAENGGKLIVLTSSASEMSDFNLDPFTAFTSAFPTKIVPRNFLRKRWYPPVENNGDGSAKFAPYGLRKVESLLLQEFSESDIVVTHPNNLHKFVGPNTKVVGISTMDPMGIAYVSTTYTSILGFGGESINAAEFRDLISHPSIKKHSPKIIVGGSGAWQIVETKMTEEYGIDTVMQGEGERTVLPTFEKAIKGEKLEKIVHGEKPRQDEIPTIKNASIYGVVEITRGCGRGCQFCTPTMRKKYSFPISHVMEEVKVNVKNNSRMIMIQTEDAFLYKANDNFKPNKEKVIELFRTLANYDGVEYIQISHTSLAPAIYSPTMIEELSEILIEKTRWKHRKKSPYVTSEVGIETGSVRLMEKYMKGKALPYSVKQWPELVVQAVGIYNDNNWYPLATLLTGLPDEKEEDTIATLELLDDLKGAKMFFTPLLFIPLEDCLLHKAHRVDLNYLNDAQWDFIATCWRYNIDFWKPDANMTISAAVAFAYPLYYRWKHGPRIIYPILKFTGWNENLIGKRLYRGCNSRYCESFEK